jgi:biotin synthase
VRDAGAPTDAIELDVRLWDPSTQLRFKAKRTVPARPDGAPNRVPVG